MNKWLALALLMMTAAACRPKKNIVAPPVVVVAKSDTASMMTADRLVGPTLKNWKYFQAKMDIEFTQNGSTTKVDAHIRMYKDSLIWISAGFGLYRIMINNDSMVILDKLNTSYTVYDKKTLTELLNTPLNVSQLQNILLGQPAYALKLYELKFYKDSNFSILYNQEKFLTAHTFNRQVMTIDSSRIDDNLTTNYAVAHYESYSVVDGYNMPLKVKLNATSKNPINLNIDFSDPDFTTELTFPFNIPSSYDRKK